MLKQYLHTWHTNEVKYNLTGKTTKSSQYARGGQRQMSSAHAPNTLSRSLNVASKHISVY